MHTDDKFAKLKLFFEQNPNIALGFSGGVDSSFLLYAALHSGANIRPYYIKSAFQPQFELDDALRLAKELGISISILEFNVLSSPVVAANPADRCYHCKTALFGMLKKRAIEDSCDIIIDGTNASDDASQRPGMKALREMAVRSPLKECGLTKPEIRELCQKAGLFVWDKPAYACLATRIPPGTPIKPELLEKIEKAEGFLMGLGFSDFRVRLFYGAAKIQLPQPQFDKAYALQSEILAGLSPLFDDILLDLNARA